MKRVTFFLLLFLCGLWSSVSVATPAADYALAQKCYYTLKETKETTPARWQECLDKFEAIATSHPKTEWGTKSRFSAGRLSQEKYDVTHDPQDIKKAIEIYNQLILETPDNNLADDALFQIALIREGITNEKDRAVHAYEAVVEKYPTGDMAPKAKQKLDEIKSGAVKQASVPTTGPHQLLAVDLWNSVDHAKVTLTFDHAALYKESVLPAAASENKPARLVLDLKETAPKSGLEAQKLVATVGLLKGVRMDQKEDGWLRIVVDADSVDHKEIVQVNQQLVIDLYRNPAPNVQTPKKAPVLPGKFQEQNLKEGALQSSPAHNKEFVIRRIVIDPGHGGKDPGAIGPRGLREKDVALQIARKLASRLKNELGLEVFLTRNKDVFLTLEQRSAFAESKKADLFISIHANAADSKQAKGVETFYLNNASSHAAERLADRENKISSKKLSDVQTILTTMLQNANTEESRDIAGQVQKHLVGSLQKNFSGVEDLGVHTALFYVLVGSKCPGILVETSFVTNPKEEMRLKDSKYQWFMAAGITHGIREYIEQQSKFASSL